jgi:hypothetical protein
LKLEQALRKPSQADGMRARACFMVNRLMLGKRFFKGKTKGLMNVFIPTDFLPYLTLFPMRSHADEQKKNRG